MKISLPKTAICITIAVVVVVLAGLNYVAAVQARAMTEFSRVGERTHRPEELSWRDKIRVIFVGVNVPRPENTTDPSAAGLVYETFTYPNGQGETLSAWHVPHGQPHALFLLFHGYAACKESLIPTAAAVSELGASALMVDFYGSGDSSGNGTSIGYREAHDVTASYRFAKGRWPDAPIVLYGLSMGGAAVLRSVAVDGTEPDGIVVESTFDTLLNTAGVRFRAMGLPPRPLADVLLFWGGRRWGFRAFAHSPSTYAREVACPTLLLYGERDRRVPPEQAEAIYRNLAGWKKLVYIPEMGHVPVVSRSPERWRAAVASLLRPLRDVGN